MASAPVDPNFDGRNSRPVIVKKRQTIIAFFRAGSPLVVTPRTSNSSLPNANPSAKASSMPVPMSVSITIGDRSAQTD